MKKPEYEVVRLNAIMCTIDSCSGYCELDCGVVGPACTAECTGYCESDCSWD